MSYQMFEFDSYCLWSGEASAGHRSLLKASLYMSRDVQLSVCAETRVYIGDVGRRGTLVSGYSARSRLFRAWCW